MERDVGAHESVAVSAALPDYSWLLIVRDVER